MKQFLLKVVVLACICLASFLILVPVFKDGYVDAFYTRFTYPAKSLIIGTSRAAQGIQPAVLLDVLGSRYDAPLLNYAFTLSHSPFGPSYLKSIRRKLVPETKNGLFIVAVDPWSLSVSKNPAEKGIVNFPEDDSFVNKLHVVNKAPNVEYLSQHLEKPFYRLLLDNIKPVEKLHKDGWLEIETNMDEKVVRAKMAGKLADYSIKARSEKLSEARLKSLKAILRFLQQHGKVYMVRIPVAPKMFEIEQHYQPGFDVLMKNIAAEFNVPYINYTPFNQQYITTDGNHLYKKSGRRLSKQLAEDILKQTP
jgi:hypothetical protein